jgi:hypothetical protein
MTRDSISFGSDDDGAGSSILRKSEKRRLRQRMQQYEAEVCIREAPDPSA